MDNKLSELSKPVAWSDERRNLCTNTIKERGLNSKYHQDYEKYSTPIYSQEYVSALLAERDAFEASALAMRDEWRARGERIAELEASETQLIQERDSSEQALADMYEAATGERPEWSNWFGFADAIEDVAQVRAELEAKLATPVRLLGEMLLHDWEHSVERQATFQHRKIAWDARLAEDKKAILAAGFTFTVEGDE